MNFGTITTLLLVTSIFYYFASTIPQHQEWGMEVTKKEISHNFLVNFIFTKI
jgi:hypothetical protein